MSSQYLTYLQYIYQQLQANPVVAAGCTDNNDLISFQNMLNTFMPKTPEDIAVGNFMRTLCSHDRRALLTYLRTSNLLHLSLLADGYCIASVLNIFTIVRIDWDQTALIYKVTKKTGGPTNDAGTMISSSSATGGLPPPNNNNVYNNTQGKRPKQAKYDQQKQLRQERRASANSDQATSGQTTDSQTTGGQTAGGQTTGTSTLQKWEDRRPNNAARDRPRHVGRSDIDRPNNLTSRDKFDNVTVDRRTASKNTTNNTRGNKKTSNERRNFIEDIPADDLLNIVEQIQKINDNESDG